MKKTATASQDWFPQRIKGQWIKVFVLWFTFDRLLGIADRSSFFFSLLENRVLSSSRPLFPLKIAIPLMNFKLALCTFCESFHWIFVFVPVLDMNTHIHYCFLRTLSILIHFCILFLRIEMIMLTCFLQNCMRMYFNDYTRIWISVISRFNIGWDLVSVKLCRYIKFSTGTLFILKKSFCMLFSLQNQYQYL